MCFTDMPLTSSFARFWKIANTFTGLKLKGHVGHFGKITATDIEGFVELPDGKVSAALTQRGVSGCMTATPLIFYQVLSGSFWGNLLLWDGSNVKVEICRKKGLSCHAGVVQPFALEDGQLMTLGSDGVIRVRETRTKTEPIRSNAAPYTSKTNSYVGGER